MNTKIDPVIENRYKQTTQNKKTDLLLYTDASDKNVYLHLVVWLIFGLETCTEHPEGEVVITDHYELYCHIGITLLRQQR